MSEKLDGKIKVNARTKKSNDEPNLQGRDTVYVDTDDDITSIISRVKESDSSIVALVPPKRIGSLQSVVNLKLLQRAAKNSRKKIALVTTDNALTALAAGLRIPVAKNLSAQPELIEAPDLDLDDNDVINGDEIAVGEIAKLPSNDKKPSSKEDKNVSAAVAAIETDDKIKNDLDADGTPDDEPKKPSKKERAKKIPNFDSFRKRVLIFGGIGVLLVAFFVWATWFAPRGTISITAKTSNKDVSATVSLLTAKSTDVENNVIQPTVKQIKKTQTVNVTATGSKDIGKKATGTVVLSNSTPAAKTLTAEARLTTSGGLVFTVNNSVTVDAASLSFGCPGYICPGTGTASVTALESGTNYNAASGSLNGAPSQLTAKFDSATSGGTSEIAKVVQQSDVDGAVNALKQQADDNSVREELKNQLGNDVTIIGDSFSSSNGTVSSKPAVGEAISGGGSSATVTMEITYTMVAVSTNDLKSLIDTKIKSDLADKQKVYDNGISSVKFSNFSTGTQGYTVVVKTIAKVGPEIDENAVKRESVNKRSGEIMSEIQKTVGVQNVNVKFWPFWVSSVSSEDKLKVEFTVDQ